MSFIQFAFTLLIVAHIILAAVLVGAELLVWLLGIK